MKDPFPELRRCYTEPILKELGSWLRKMLQCQLKNSSRTLWHWITVSPGWVYRVYCPTEAGSLKEPSSLLGRMSASESKPRIPLWSQHPEWDEEGQRW